MPGPPTYDRHDRASRAGQRRPLHRRACGARPSKAQHHRPRRRPAAIYNEDGSKVITFNGEIYNYQTLREELIAAGHTFTTKSDTEVLLHGYEQWGVDLLQRVRGMFTFVIWDKNKQELFGARDHFGIKPSTMRR